jgi:hypothetical protein
MGLVFKHQSGLTLVFAEFQILYFGGCFVAVRGCDKEGLKPVLLG